MEADLGSIQFLLDEAVAVEPVSGVKEKEGGHTQNDRSQNLISDTEVVMRETAALVCQDAIVRVWGGIFRHADAKCPTLFHALEDEVDPVSLLLHQTTQSG
jgi:hypothetical protein